MAHIPVNHPLRPLYRVLGFVVGGYLVLFGIVGLIQTSGKGFTGATGVRVLGQQTNGLWSLLAGILGAIIVLTTLVGRNLDTEGDKYVGWGLLVLGTYSIASIRTDANFLGFSVATVVVTYLVGMTLIMVSLYSKTAPIANTAPARPVRPSRAG